jgi:hypothetical protein
VASHEKMTKLWRDLLSMENKKQGMQNVETERIKNHESKIENPNVLKALYYTIF